MGSMLALGSTGTEICLLTVYSGRDDFICIAGGDGSMRVWHNTPGPEPRKPNVRYADSLALPNYPYALNTLNKENTNTPLF
jgi:hypothetical protein